MLAMLIIYSVFYVVFFVKTIHVLIKDDNEAYKFCMVLATICILGGVIVMLVNI